MSCTKFLFLFILVLPYLFTNSEKTRPGCKPACSGHGPSFLKYEQGFSYTYVLQTTTQLRLTSQDHSNFNLDGYAILTPISSCTYDLSVVNLKATTQFHGTNTNVEKKIDIPDSQLQFNFENGTIGLVCTTEMDSFFSANIKRSIVSLLQLSSLHEDADFKVNEVQNDVMGLCPTDIERIGNVYYKRRDLNKCTRRQAGPAFVNGVPYDFVHEKFKSLPILDSKLSCKQELHGNVIQRSVCNEENVLVNPFSKIFSQKQSHSNDSSVPKIILKSSLSLLNHREIDSSQRRSATPFILSSINFDFSQKSDIEPNTKNNSEVLDTVLIAMCKDFVDENLSKDTPEHFLQMRDALYELKKQDVIQAYEKITILCPSHQNKLEKIYLKTAAKTSSVGLMGELLISNRMPFNGEITSEFLKNLPFAQRPRRHDLPELLKILKLVLQESGEDRLVLKNQFILSVSTFAHQYCKITNSKCDNVQEYISLVDFIAEEILRNCKGDNDENSDGAVVGLQALGNLEKLTPMAVNCINKCMSSKVTRIKIHSLSASRRDPCHPFLKRSAKSVFTDLRLGTDVRIHSFLAIFRCIQMEDIQLIQRALDNEQSNQLSSFIHSFISNQLESASQGKQPLKTLLRKLHLERQFPRSMESFGRFSKNIELSAFSNTFNMGSLMESNIIYSQHSYIPKTLSLNFTMDLFGRSYNFFEAGIYLENYENLFSRFHAPLSTFDETDKEEEERNYMEFYSDLNEFSNYSDPYSTPMTIEDDEEKQIVKTEMRHMKPRIKPEDIQHIAKQVKIKDRYTDEGTCDTFLRLHGTTIGVTTIRQKNFPAFYNFEWLTNKYDDLINSFKMAILERTKPITFLDEHVMIATSGLPINIKVDWSNIISSKYSVNIDFPSLFSKLEEKEMNFKLIPNAASLLKTKITIGPESFIKVGFQFEGKVHLSAAADLSLEKKTNSLKINYHFPLEKFRVFEFETKQWWIEDVGALSQRKINFGPEDRPETRTSQCTNSDSYYFNLISPHQFGVKYCSMMVIPQSFEWKSDFWLQGPLFFKISSEKLDDMRGFSLEIKMNEKTTEESAFTVVFDAPGSKTNRKIELVAKFIDSVLPTIFLLVDYPSNNSPFNLIAKIHDTESLRGISATISHGQGVPANYQCALKIVRNDNKILYEPICFSQIGEDAKMNYAVGTVNRGLGEYLDVDLTLTSPFTNRGIILKGLIERRSKEQVAENGGFHFKLTNGELAYNNPDTADDSMYSLHALLTGEFFKKTPTLGFDFDLKYGKNQPDKDIQLKSIMTYLPSKKIGIETKAVSQKLKFFNVDFKFLTEWIKEEETDENILNLQCYLANFFNFDAVKKTGNNNASLNLCVEIVPLKRKLALKMKVAEKRDEKTSELTKFDFENTFKWDDGRDDQKKIFLLLDFKRTDVQDSYLVESRKELDFMGEVHRVNLLGKIPINLSNGVYNITAKYLSPMDRIYGITYVSVVAKEDSQMSSETEMRVDLSSIDPIFVTWRKHFASTTSPFRNYKIQNDFSVVMGEEEGGQTLTNMTFLAKLLNEDGVKRIYQSGFSLNGEFVPPELEIEVMNRVKYFEKKLMASSSEFKLPYWGGGQWTLHKVPDVMETLYQLKFNWTPNKFHSHSHSIDFSTQVGGHLSSILDFKMKSNGSLKLSQVAKSIKVWEWEQELEGSKNQIGAYIDFNPGTNSSELRFKTGYEGEVVIFQSSFTGKDKNFVFDTNFRADVDQPSDLIIFSISIGNPKNKMWVISVRSAREADIYIPTVTIALPGVSIHMVNLLELGALKKRLNSNIIMYINGMEEVTKSLSLSVEKSKEHESGWNFEIVNIIEDDETVIKAFGTFVSSGTTWTGNLEAVKFYGTSGGTLQVFVDTGEMEKSFKISGNFNGVDQELVEFKLKTREFEKNLIHEGYLIYPSYRQYRNSYAFGLFPGLDFQIERKILSMELNREEGRELKIKVNKKEADSSVPSMVKGEVLLKSTDLEKRAFVQCNFGSFEDFALADVSWFNVEGSQSEQKLRIFTLHSVDEEQNNGDDVPLVVKLNLTSGLQWIKTSQENLNSVKIDEAKTLCIVIEKMLEATNKEFDICTLGFSSHRNWTDREEAKENILDLKFTLLDRILFQGMRVEKVDNIQFSSSFWLDYLDKPSEQLKFSVLKMTQDKSLNYVFTVKHPFLPRDLQTKLVLENDEKTLSSVVLELDIFEREFDKVFVIGRILSANSGDDFDDYFRDNYDEPKEDISGTPASFEASIQSEGLPILLKFEGSMASISGTSYSFRDRDGQLQQGKFICKLPSLFDPNILQLGDTSILSVAFKGVPRVELHPLKVSNNSLMIEYHGSPHSLRFFQNQDQIQGSEQGAEDYGDETENKNPDDFNFYVVTIPKMLENEIMLSFSKQSRGFPQSLLNVTVSLNTSRLLRIQHQWDLAGMKKAMTEFKRRKSDFLKDLKINVIASTKEMSQNVVHYGQTFFNALPNIQQLLDKLEKEFQENLQEIQRDPRSSIVYEYFSGSMWSIHLFSKSVISDIGMMMKNMWQVIVDFVMENDWEEEFRQIYISIQDEVFSGLALAIGKVKEIWEGAVAKVHHWFDFYAVNNPEFEQITQIFEEILDAGKTQGLKLLRFLLQKTIKLRPLLKWGLSKEVHEFLVSLKHYSLDKLQRDQEDNYYESLNDTEFDVGNVSSASMILSKGYNVVLKMGQRVLERKGFDLQYVHNESLVIQFPLPKPARSLMDLFNAIYSREKGQVFGTKYKLSLRDFYRWITEPTTNESRLPKWSVILSRIDNVLLGGIGPQDSMALILNGKYFRTFDGRFHSHQDKCQYLLAADFLNEANVTLNIDGDGDSRAFILTYNEENLIIHVNASIEWNGQLAEIPMTETFEFIPFNMGPFKAFRYGNVLGDIVEVTMDHTGFDIACLVNYPVCSIRLKSYLFGRSAGLLGTNNLEEFDDFGKPDDEIVGKTSKFYRSWRLNRDCTDTQFTRMSTPTPEMVNNCTEIFTSDVSPLSPCFDEVPVVEFQEVCENLILEGKGDENIKMGMCTIAAAYWVQCTFNQIKVDYLPGCL